MKKNISNMWKPNASIKNLFKRAKIIKKIRIFFYNRGFLEVNTPSMSQSTSTDVNLFPFETNLYGCNKIRKLYLVTSPEFHMKRLLSAGSGPIFQLCSGFRNMEYGQYHNPEFTILEWYRPNYNMYQLMKEASDFLKEILSCKNARFQSYQKIFLRYTNIDPISENKIEIYKKIKSLNLGAKISIKDDRNTLLNLVFITKILPNIGKTRPIFIYHFPSYQSELSQINEKDNRVSDRFEIYFHGIEIANGSCELTSAIELYKRFMKNNRSRVKIHLKTRPIDKYFINALKYGKFPKCSGIALGIDRLVMLAVHAKNIKDVLSFAIDRS